MAIDPSILSSAISGGSNIMDVGISAIMQSKDRKWQEKMYNRQRADALADWNMQNAYNNPSAQMERLKAAHLNPHLVYGQGAVGNNSGSVRSSSPGSWKPQLPSLNLGEGVATYFDTKMKQSQMDLIQKQKDNIDADIALKQGRTIGIGIDNLLKGEYGGKRMYNEVEQLKWKNLILAKYGMDTADWSLRQKQADVTKKYTDVGLGEARIDYTKAENLRRDLLTGANLQRTASQIALMAAQQEMIKSNIDLNSDRGRLIGQQIENAIKDGSLKEIEIYLNEMKKSPWDKEIINNVGGILRKIIPGFK